ncbi:hypothetical protein RJ639_014431 [Escallonia herrerae]|uniref:Transposase (putative) gypsy type domain-containing protein n=1 Tax=Escallonia herrerae TaxID=1293975 RepID=A0AA88VIC2_9ASTE|nr:hypothetical protein RJ639_014431 [Escallonia herrerae]
MVVRMYLVLSNELIVFPLPKKILEVIPRVPALQEPANYGTKFETGIYKEQVKSGYRLPLHPFALSFFKHYHMAPGQLVPNGWRKLVGLIYLVETSGYKADSTNFIRVFFKICFVKRVANCPGWYYIHSRQRLLMGGPKSNKGWHSRYFFVGREDKKDLPFDRDWNPYCKDFENLGKPTPNNLILAISSFEKWPLKAGNHLQEGSQASFKRLGEKEGKTAKCRATPCSKEGKADCSNLYSQIYVSGSTMLSLFEMVRQVAAEEAQQKRDAIKEAEEATYCTEELSKRVADYSTHIEALERLLERAKKRVMEEAKKVTEARDQGIRDFLDENTEEEWLKKRTDDGLEIYEMGFTKAKEMFAECFPTSPWTILLCLRFFGWINIQHVCDDLGVNPRHVPGCPCKNVRIGPPLRRLPLPPSRTSPRRRHTVDYVVRLPKRHHPALHPSVQQPSTMLLVGKCGNAALLGTDQAVDRKKDRADEATVVGSNFTGEITSKQRLKSETSIPLLTAETLHFNGWYLVTQKIIK